MAFITMMIKNTTYNIPAAAIGSHKGDKTHHHAQSIAPNSLRVINTMVNPKKPIPLVLDVSLSIMLNFKKGAPLWWAEFRT